nr:hypothetical protein CFP56_62734 [Quercus suber]
MLVVASGSLQAWWTEALDGRLPGREPVSQTVPVATYGWIDETSLRGWNVQSHSSNAGDLGTRVRSRRRALK